MKVVFDTSFLIELKKGNKKAVEALERRKEECRDIIVSSLTVYELLVGSKYVWKKHGNAKEMMIINDMLKFLTVVPVDLDVLTPPRSVVRGFLVGRFCEFYASDYNSVTVLILKEILKYLQKYKKSSLKMSRIGCLKRLKRGLVYFITM